MEENERLAKHTSQLTLDNHALRQQLPNLPLPDGKRRLSVQVSTYLAFASIREQRMNHYS